MGCPHPPVSPVLVYQLNRPVDAVWAVEADLNLHRGHDSSRLVWLGSGSGDRRGLFSAGRRVA